MRHLLACTCLTPVLLVATGTQALADRTVSSATTAPIATATATSGAPDNVVVTSAGSIKLTSGTAITIDITANASLPNVADLSARVGADYRTAIGADAELVLTSTARYVGHSRLGIGPILGVEQGGWFDLGLGARIERGDQSYSLTITNLLDQAGNRYAFGSPFTLVENPQVTPMRPLTIRLGWQVAF